MLKRAIEIGHNPQGRLMLAVWLRFEPFMFGSSAPAGFLGDPIKLLDSITFLDKPPVLENRPTTR
jgi:hypothetical protein